MFTMRENLGYKILAVLIAALLWIKVNSERNPNVTKRMDNVQVRYEGLRKAYVMTGQPSHIWVDVTGPQTVLRSLKPSQIRATADLTGIGLGAQSVKVSMSLPSEAADKVNLAPQDFKVWIEAFKRKSTPIKVVIGGVPPLGYTIGKAAADPSAAVISGAGSLVDQVHRLLINVNAGVAQTESETYYTVVAMDRAGNKIKGLTIEPSRVGVKLDLQEAPANKYLIVSPTIIGQPVYPFKVASITVFPSSVTVYGRPDQLAKLSTIPTHDLDISNASSTISRSVGLSAPPGANIGNVRSVRVTVTITQ